MAKGLKTGGRTKGSPNRATRDVMERLNELNCDPLEGMASIAADQNNTPELRGRMYGELAQYVYPKRKAIELGSVDNDGGVRPLELQVRFIRSPIQIEEPEQVTD
jgi:hypothetical protein